MLLNEIFCYVSFVFRSALQLSKHRIATGFIFRENSTVIMMSILDALAKNAQDQPNQAVWTFLNDHGDVSDSYTYQVWILLFLLRKLMYIS